MGAQLAVTCARSCNATIARTAQFKQWIDKVASAQTVVSAQQIIESFSLLAVASAFVAVWPLCAYINLKAQVFLQHSLKKVDAAALQNDRAHKLPKPATSSPAEEQTLSSLEEQTHATLPSSSASFQPAPSSAASSSKSAVIERTRLLVSSALHDAAAQRARILIVCGVVVVANIPRCIYSVMNSYGSMFNDLNRACKQCESCQNDHSLINTWLGLMPEIAIFVTMFSEPVALSLSLWCMLTPRERRILREGCTLAESSDTQALAFLNQGVHIALPVEMQSVVQ